MLKLEVSHCFDHRASGISVGHSCELLGGWPHGCNFVVPTGEKRHLSAKGFPDSFLIGKKQKEENVRKPVRSIKKKGGGIRHKLSPIVKQFRIRSKQRPSEIIAPATTSVKCEAERLIYVTPQRPLAAHGGVQLAGPADSGLVELPEKATQLLECPVPDDIRNYFLSFSPSQARSPPLEDAQLQGTTAVDKHTTELESAVPYPKENEQSSISTRFEMLPQSVFLPSESSPIQSFGGMLLNENVVRLLTSPLHEIIPPHLYNTFLSASCDDEQLKYDIAYSNNISNVPHQPSFSHSPPSSNNNGTSPLVMPPTVAGTFASQFPSQSMSEASQHLQFPLAYPPPACQLTSPTTASSFGSHHSYNYASHTASSFAGHQLAASTRQLNEFPHIYEEKDNTFSYKMPGPSVRVSSRHGLPFSSANAASGPYLRPDIACHQVAPSIAFDILSPTTFRHPSFNASTCPPCGSSNSPPTSTRTESHSPTGKKVRRTEERCMSPQLSASIHRKKIAFVSSTLQIGSSSQQQYSDGYDSASSGGEFSAPNLYHPPQAPLRHRLNELALLCGVRREITNQLGSTLAPETLRIYCQRWSDFIQSVRSQGLLGYIRDDCSFPDSWIEAHANEALAVGHKAAARARKSAIGRLQTLSRLEKSARYEEQTLGGSGQMEMTKLTSAAEQTTTLEFDHANEVSGGGGGGAPDVVGVPHSVDGEWRSGRKRTRCEMVSQVVGNGRDSSVVADTLSNDF